MINLHHGGNIHTRRSDFIQSMRGEQESRSLQTLYIVPTHRFKSDLIEEILSEDGVFWHPYLYSLSDWIMDMHRYTSIETPELHKKQLGSDVMKDELFRAAATEAHIAYQHYEILSDPNAPLGIWRQLRIFLEDLINTGWSAERFAQQSHRFFTLGQQSDLVRLMDIYQSHVNSYLHDEPVRINDLLAHLTDDRMHRIYRDIETIWMFGIDVLSDGLIKLIRLLSDISYRIRFDVAGRVQTDGELRHTHAFWQKIAGEGVTVKTYPLDEPVELTCTEYLTPEMEFRATISDIYQQLKKGATLADIIICYPDLDSIREDLERWGLMCGLPLDISSGYPLAEHPLVVWIFDWIEISDGPFRSGEVIRLTSRPQSPIQPLPAKIVERLQADPSWLDALTTLDDPDPEWQHWKQECLRLRLPQLSDLVEVDEISSRIEAIIDAFYDRNMTTNSLVQAHSARAIYDFEEWVSQSAAALKAAGRGMIPFTEFRELLRRQVVEHRYQPARQPYSAIQILPYSEARFSQPKQLYICGLNQSDFPRTSRRNALIPADVYEDYHIEEAELVHSREAAVLSWLIAKPDTRVLLSASSGADASDMPSILLESAGISIQQRPSDVPAFPSSTTPFTLPEIQISPELNIQIKQQFSDTHVYSTTQFESYMTCPQQFFRKYVLKQTVPEDYRDQMDHLLRGSLVHNVLMELTNQPDVYYGDSDARQQWIDAFLSRQLLEFGFKADSMAAMELRLDRMAATIEAAVQVDLQSLTEYQPAFREWRFGPERSNKPEDPYSTDQVLQLDTPDGPIRIRGQIDRIDLSSDGGALVIDYKTGSTPSLTDIRAFKKVQLPLYCLAVDTLMPDVSVDAAIYLAIRKPAKTVTLSHKGRIETSTGLVWVDDGKENSRRLIYTDFVKGLSDQLNTVRQRIRAADFPYEPTGSGKSIACVQCDYRRVCPYTRHHRVDPGTDN